LSANAPPCEQGTSSIGSHALNGSLQNGWADDHVERAAKFSLDDTGGSAMPVRLKLEIFEILFLRNIETVSIGVLKSYKLAMFLPEYPSRQKHGAEFALLDGF
jgi:hypothetical protein